MAKKIIQTSKAPTSIGPYSQAVVSNGTLYISGQLPIEPESNIMPESVEEQVEQSMKNILAIVNQAGAGAEDILKCGLFIKDMSTFSRINEVYKDFFTSEPPARFVVEVSELPKGALVEIDAIAAV